MYKNALDLYERLIKAANTYNERNKLPVNFGATVLGDNFGITRTHVQLLTVPVPGKVSAQFQALVNYDNVRIVNARTQMTIVSFELDLEYHTFMGFVVNNGVLAVACKYELPAKYDTVTFLPLAQDRWEELTKDIDL